MNQRPIRLEFDRRLIFSLTYLILYVFIGRIQINYGMLAVKLPNELLKGISESGLPRPRSTNHYHTAQCLVILLFLLVFPQVLRLS
jgi:hypothetical protein